MTENETDEGGAVDVTTRGTTTKMTDASSTKTGIRGQSRGLAMMAVRAVAGERIAERPCLVPAMSMRKMFAVTEAVIAVTLQAESQSLMVATIAMIEMLVIAAVRHPDTTLGAVMSHTAVRLGTIKTTTLPHMPEGAVTDTTMIAGAHIVALLPCPSGRNRLLIPRITSCAPSFAPNSLSDSRKEISANFSRRSSARIPFKMSGSSLIESREGARALPTSN
jgi:hypothetical protein